MLKLTNIFKKIKLEITDYANLNVMMDFMLMQAKFANNVLHPAKPVLIVLPLAHLVEQINQEFKDIFNHLSHV